MKKCYLIAFVMDISPGGNSNVHNINIVIKQQEFTWPMEQLKMLLSASHEVDNINLTKSITDDNR